MLSTPDNPSGIPGEAITFQFIRASGPGGQNVNKVASAVQMRVDLERADLPAAVRRRLEALVPSQITQAGELVISAQRFRSQLRNREDALERLDDLLTRARQVPRRRIATRPSLTQKRKRKESKKQRGALKKARAKPKIE